MVAVTITAIPVVGGQSHKDEAQEVGCQFVFQAIVCLRTPQVHQAVNSIRLLVVNCGFLYRHLVHDQRATACLQR